jgi:AcrR family transcriptional regulator
MIEMVANGGYEVVKVRELVHLAGVSSRAFYTHFESKEDCFLRTHDLVVRRASRRIIGAQAGEDDWRKRPRLIFDAFVAEMEENPAAARLALIEAYAGSAAALEQARKTDADFETMLAQSLARAPGGMRVPPLVVEGIRAGVARVARTRLLAGQDSDLSQLSEEMLEWALCFPGKSADLLADLDLQLIWRDTRLQPAVAPSGEEDAGATTDDRTSILTSLTSITAGATANGYGDLTVERIRRGAGVPRKVFKLYFEGVEDCFVAALEQCASEACAQAARAQAAGSAWPGGLYRAMSVLCDHVFEDSLLMGVCLADHFKPGSTGSRIRRRLLSVVAEQLADSVPSAHRPSSVVAEASSGAVWALFHHHVVRALAQSAPKVAASLAFMALAPAVGAPAAVAAIGAEQAE